MTRMRPLSVAWRLAVLLMVIAVGGCDNVEWGGIHLAIVPPPDKSADDAAAAIDRGLPTGPLLFYVRRDNAGATVIPVGQIMHERLGSIEPGDDPAAFGARFIDAFLAPGTELTLFRRGQRVGTVTIDSARMPEPPVCRPLPRATGTVTLTAGAGDVTEFLALANSDAPEGRLAGASPPERRMAVVGDMLAGEMLQSRGTPVANPATARRQLHPFPLTGNPDPGFTATYLVDDSLDVGGDNTGASLFVVFTPQGQTGYDTALVSFADYQDGGKAAPRVIDFLDWDRDQANESVELLLDVFGTRTTRFRAVGLVDGQWVTIFEDRCDPRTSPVDTVEADPDAQSVLRRRRRLPALDSIPEIEPTIQLSNPDADPSVRRDTTPLRIRGD